MKQFLFGSTFTGNKAFTITWLLFRFYSGITIAIGAGWPKMNQIAAPGWFIDQVSKLGFTFPSPAFWAAAAAWGEFVGGLCIAIGFFTRFSAIQLAFQFFVVSFIWYDNPMPFFGMYYQQLIFWGFVLISVGGSGKYSVDSWILNHKKQIDTTYAVAATAAVMLCIFSSFIQKPVVLQTNDLLLLRGTWKGNLSYKDYTSNSNEKIPVIIYGYCKDANEKTCRTWRLKFEYSDEPKANQEADYAIGKDGRTFNGAVLIKKEKLKDGTLQFVTEQKGKDGNDQKACTIRYVYQLNYSLFSITKLVRFDDEKDFFERNEYKVTR
jgi:uncharacterized membrane protein YphA (DoxX/SURF4 family)